MGTAFSYALYCTEYVELASEKWNVLLCRESEDAEALRCGSTRPLTQYHNGTVGTPQRGADGIGANAVHLVQYENYLEKQVFKDVIVLEYVS